MSHTAPLFCAQQGRQRLAGGWAEGQPKLGEVLACAEPQGAEAPWRDCSIWTLCSRWMLLQVQQVGLELELELELGLELELELICLLAPGSK